mgnify:FL=1|jgi:glycosyltransferase involved in cell wall biosynthesis
MINNKELIFFMPFIGGGGVEKNLFIISNFFSKKLKNITICTHSKKYKNKFNKNIKFLTPKTKLLKKCSLKTKYLFCLIILFKFLLHKKNVVVFSFQANIYCILLCKLLGIKIIVRSNSSPSGWYHNFIKKFFYKKIISFANKVIVNSLEFKKQMDKRFNIDAHCIFNPLNIHEILKKSKYAKKDTFFITKKKCLKLINIGRFTDQKDQITILKAANLLKDKINFKLIIAGRGVEEKKLKRYIKDHNLNHLVKIRNFLENPYPVMKQSDFLILSSKYEGLPNVLLEGIVLNKLIISSDCPTGPKEILSKGKGGYLFKIGDYNELSNKIIYYYKNKSKINSMLKFSKKNIKRFDYDINLNKYYNLVKSFL